MAEILVRDLSADVVERLKARAHMHGRSLQKEIKLILEESAPIHIARALELVERWQTHSAGRSFSDSAEQLRRDRER